MNWLGDLLDGPLWPLAFLVVYPTVAVLAIEGARAWTDAIRSAPVYRQGLGKSG